jgi:hypothetical protein
VFPTPGVFRQAKRCFGDHWHCLVKEHSLQCWPCLGAALPAGARASTSSEEVLVPQVVISLLLVFQTPVVQQSPWSMAVLVSWLP